MPDDETYAIIDKVGCDATCLRRITLIIPHRQMHLLAIDATRRIDIIDGRLSTVAQLLAKRGQFTRHRAGNANLDDVITGSVRNLPSISATASEI